MLLLKSTSFPADFERLVPLKPLNSKDLEEILLTNKYINHIINQKPSTKGVLWNHRNQLNIIIIR